VNTHTEANIDFGTFTSLHLKIRRISNNAMRYKCRGTKLQDRLAKNAVQSEHKVNADRLSEQNGTA